MKCMSVCLSLCASLCVRGHSQVRPSWLSMKKIPRRLSGRGLGLLENDMLIWLISLRNSRYLYQWVSMLRFWGAWWISRCNDSFTGGYLHDLPLIFCHSSSNHGAIDVHGFVSIYLNRFEDETWWNHFQVCGIPPRASLKVSSWLANLRLRKNITGAKVCPVQRTI